MEMEYRLRVAAEIACSEFESFCREKYSLSSLFRPKSIPTETTLVQFKLELIAARNSEFARFEFRPAPHSQSFIAFRLSDTWLDADLEGIGLLLCILLFCDFVLYLDQMGYFTGDISEVGDTRNKSLRELRQLTTMIPDYLSELKSKRKAQMSQLPPGVHPVLESIYNGMKSLVENADEGTTADLMNTIEWYLEAYSVFPQLVSGGEAFVGKLTMDLQIGRPGRPRNKAYDEAYTLLASGKMDINRVYEWFCKEENIVKPDKGVRDAFKAAMKRRRKDT